MAINNLPDLNQLVTFEFNSQVLYDILLDMTDKIENQQQRIKKLEEQLKNKND
jgi:hypothetical protein